MNADPNSLVPLPPTDAVIDGGDLDCGSGLLLMIRSAMEPLDAGGVLEVRSREISVREDLPAWCRMVGHSLLAVRASGTAGVSFLVRKKGGADTEFDAHLAKARNHGWKVRAKLTTGIDVRVFARNHQFDLGQPASFNTEDPHPGAVEVMIGALASCIVSGLAWRLRRAGWNVANIEAALSAKPGNILVFLDIEEEGSPGVEVISGRVFVSAEAPAAVDDAVSALQTVFEDTLRRSPVARTLSHGTRLEISCTLVV